MCFVDERLSGLVVGLYFGRTACPKCEKFTEKLQEVYEHVRDNVRTTSRFEVVYISIEGAPHRGEPMPWLTLPREGSPEICRRLCSRFSVKEAPTLVMLSEVNYEREGG